MKSPVSPQIGQFYRVPVITVPEVRIVAPVLLPLHEDADLLGFAPFHFHVDWRFVNRSHRWAWTELRHASNTRRGVGTIYGQVVCIEGKFKIDGAWSKREYSLSLKRTRCVREWPEWPSWGTAIRGVLTEAFAGKVAPDCKTCPHRGISLEVGRRFHHPETGRETVECPGHGLWWDVETGQCAGLRKREGHHV